MSSGEGVMLSHYRIGEKIGEGGMGVVWRATDTKLDREVAIKVLPENLAQDPERLSRFEREARVLASLNHQNVAAIFGIEHQVTDKGVSPVLVLEYVPGETLAERLERGRLPLDDALETAAKIAEGLEAAHEIGIIHRDLKPANIKLTPDGRVKILDFGLAKAFASEPADAPAGSQPTDFANSPTITTGGTRLGSVMGTASYMSPEQARGKQVDKRTDIWSFGCVLYEMLTGNKPFPGETAADVMGAVLHLEPDWEALPPAASTKIGELVWHCIEKDPRKRLRDIGDARIALQEALALRTSAPGRSVVGLEAGDLIGSRPSARSGETRRAGSSGPFRAMGSDRFGTPGRRTALLVKAMWAALGLLLGVGAWAALGSRGATPRGPAGLDHDAVARLSITTPPNIEVLSVGGSSADGRTVIVRGRPRVAAGKEPELTRVYVRRLDSYDFVPLKGTEGAYGAVASPDGRWIAFIAPALQGSSQSRLFKMPLDGGAPPMNLADWDASYQGLVWLERGDFITSTSQGTALVRIPGGGGAPAAPIKIDAGSFQAIIVPVRALPEDAGILAQTFSYSPRGFQIGVALVDASTGKARLLVEDGGNPSYLPDGHLLFARGPTLLAAPFDLDALKVTGSPVALLDGLRTDNSWSPGGYGVSRSGNLGYLPGGQVGGRRRIAIADQKGTVAAWSDEPRAFEQRPSASRDGRHLAVVVANASAIYEIWASERDRPVFRRVIAIPNVDCYSPLWSPTGDALAFVRVAKNDDDGVYVQRVDGPGQPRRIFKSESKEVEYYPWSWSADGAWMLLGRRTEGKWDVMLLPVPKGAAESGAAASAASQRAAGAGSAAAVGPGGAVSGSAAVAGGAGATAGGSESGSDAVKKAGAAEPVAVLVFGEAYNEADAQFSPDGRWIALTTDQTGKSEVYLSAFGPGGAPGVPTQVSHGGGAAPRWSPDGRTLYWVSDNKHLMSAAMSEKPGSSPIAAQVEGIDLGALRASNPISIAPLQDGRVAFVQKGEEEDEIHQINVVLNWSAEAEKKLAASR